MHATSRDYDLAGLAADPARLSGVVSRDAPYLGDLTGLDAVHVQCHIGTDTISLARLGARVTGIDFSPTSLAAARELAANAGIDATFVESELYAIPDNVDATFDLVYTGVGALCWLPDIAGWARVVAGLLGPGGRLYVRDGHPMLATLDDEREDQTLIVTYPYFEGAPTRFESNITYADDAEITEPVMYEWNHGLGEIVQAVLDAGLTVTALREHDHLEWRQFRWMEPTADGQWVLPAGRERLPMMFTLEAASEEFPPSA